MHQAVELILKRMESNPEEFTGDSADRWMRHLKRYEDFMSDDEREAIQTKQREIMMDVMHKDIMAELLYGDERRRQEEEFAKIVANVPKRLVVNPTYQPHQVTGFPVNNTIAMQADTMTLGGESLDKKTLKRLKALLK
jgi:hypothetical protein